MTPLENALRQAIIDKDIELAVKLIPFVKKNNGLQARDANGNSFLQLAITVKATALIEELVSDDIGFLLSHNTNGETLLHTAVKAENAEAVKELLEIAKLEPTSEYVNRADELGNTALHYAMKQYVPQPEIITHLVASGADFFVVNNELALPTNNNLLRKQLGGEPIESKEKLQYQLCNEERIIISKLIRDLNNYLYELEQLPNYPLRDRLFAALIPFALIAGLGYMVYHRNPEESTLTSLAKGFSAFIACIGGFAAHFYLMFRGTQVDSQETRLYLDKIGNNLLNRFNFSANGNKPHIQHAYNILNEVTALATYTDLSLVRLHLDFLICDLVNLRKRINLTNTPIGFFSPHPNSGLPRPAENAGPAMTIQKCIPC